MNFNVHPTGFQQGAPGAGPAGLPVRPTGGLARLNDSEEERDDEKSLAETAQSSPGPLGPTAEDREEVRRAELSQKVFGVTLPPETLNLLGATIDLRV